MTKLIIQSNNDWAKRKIKNTIDNEIVLLEKAILRTQKKIQAFEDKFGKLDRKTLYGKIDDMDLVEWEGELEVLDRLQERFSSIQEITFEYR
jgi:hypothetical protein